MLVREILTQNRISLSFELFPPKTEKSSENLFKNIKNFTPLEPAYVSVTYGAGGSTRELTHNLVVKLHKETNLTIVAHLTCVASTQDEIRKILEMYDEKGITNIMALRGDPPGGQATFTPPKNGFRYASELVAFIKKHFPHMGIGVAGFPEGHQECPNRLLELEYLKRKVDAGADYICTQFFFDNRDFYDFQERCVLTGINIPIIAGIMPVNSIEGAKKMAGLAMGARFPARLLKSILRADNNDAIKAVGIHWATEQVRDLIDNNVKGIHFYTLNKSDSVTKICSSLGIESSKNLETENTLQDKF